MAKRQTSKSQIRSRARTSLFGFMVVLAIFFAHQKFPRPFEVAELKMFDLRLYSTPGNPPSGEVVIAAIDDRSIAELGQWPWPRQKFAQLENALREYKSAAVGFDVVFGEQDENDTADREITDRLKARGLKEADIREIVGPSNDSAFADALRAQGASVLSYFFENHNFTFRSGSATIGNSFRTIQPPAPITYQIVMSRGSPPLISGDAYVPPIKILAEAAHGSGYVDIDSDLDGEIRTELLLIKFDGRYCTHMIMGTADLYAGGPPLSLVMNGDGINRIAIGKLQIPVDPVGRMMVRFRGPAGTFKRISVSDIIARKVPPADLDGKIVLVGMTATALGDRAVTPVGGEVPRVEIHANAIDNILRGDFISRPLEGVFVERVAAVALGVAIVLAAAFLSALSSLSVAVIFATGYFLYVENELRNTGALIGVVFPLAMVFATYTMLVSYRYVTEGREKAYIRHAFEHYLHPAVIAALVDNHEGLKLGGERRHLAILFADIVSFTSRAERTEPEALVALLNTYMTSMTDVIMQSGGVVDKLMGDGIMAFWGAPAVIANPSRAAVDCAIQMLENLHKLQTTDERFHDLDIGIGIATGDAVVGNFGGEHRFDYSVIGDTVNFSSRLEGLTRHFKVHLLVSLKTLQEAGAGYISREIGLVKVKGKEILVPIVEVAGRANDSVDPDFFNRFGAVLGSIRAGDAAAARTELNAMHEQRPTDRVVSLYLDKIGANPAQAPREMVFEFESK